MTETKAPVSVEEFRMRFSGWLAYREMDGSWHTREEWINRGEFVMTLAPLHLTSNSIELADDVYETEMSQLLHSMGWWYERGYAWSMHFFPGEYGEEFSSEERLLARMKERAGFAREMELRGYDPMTD